jgi:hypothetical protein
MSALCSWRPWETRSAVGSECEEEVRDFGSISRWGKGRWGKHARQTMQRHDVNVDT